MSLAEIPLVLTLTGLVAYTVLGGADFGAGLWFFITGRGGDQQDIREHTFHAMGPVWEANHVWLIFVLVVCWTAYPVAFGSIASTLAVPLFIAAVGVICRGTAYALRSGNPSPRQDSAIGAVFSLSSVVTPFALGAAVGGIASGRVPVGNAEGHLFSSWLNPTSLVIGLLAVATSAYMAAVFLAADAARQEDRAMTEAFRRRALIAALVAGALAAAGVLVLAEDAPNLFDGLTEGGGLVALGASVAAGIGTLALVARSRFAPARYTAGIAVAAIVAGWGIAQSPTFLPGLTVEEAATDDSTIVVLLAGLAVGALILVPSLFVLFRLVLTGRFDTGVHLAISPFGGGGPATGPRLLPLAFPLALGLSGAVMLIIATVSWLQVIGALALLSAVAVALPALVLRVGAGEGG
ncbi:MAG TPA: cytochrome d ubiquinol oxidase subunit II [Solirubrobacterales bacterium]|nr:cytochrome d ubiquinol oxidase subunit II [Solirubrobacterales bacterium]